MEPLLHSPASHSLAECLRELKFGRPASQQLVLDETINFIRSRLGDDGPCFPPEIVGAVFDNDTNAEDKMIIHDGCGLPVELCECKDAPVRYNSETDTFDEKPPAERKAEEERFTSANSASTKFPTFEEVESYINAQTFLGSYNGQPSKIKLCYDYIVGKLRA